jgi:hypothetical protein
MQFDKKDIQKDILYLAVLVVFSFLLLSQVKDIPLSSYSSLADAKAKGIAPVIDILYLPVFIGLIAVIALYAILRIKVPSFQSFIALLLMVTSASFINNFTLGSFSFPVAVLFGEINLSPVFSIQNLQQVIFLIPFALFVLIYSIYKKKYETKNSILILLIALVGVILSFILPLLSLPFLMVCAAYSLKSSKEDKEESIVFGLFLAFGCAISLMPNLSITAFVLALFSGVLVALLLFLTEMRQKLNVLLILVLLFMSVVGSAVNLFTIHRIDPETITALTQLSQIQGKVAVVSIYDEIAPAVYYLSGKTINAKEGLQYVFSEGAGNRSFDYLLIDTLILDDSKNYSAKVNQTTKFETFAFARTSAVQTDASNYTAAIFYSKNSVMLMPVDEKGNLISDKVEIGGEWIPISTLLELNATAGYGRYIYPKGDSKRNILNVLFPDQFLFNESKLVWQSNTTRMRLYKFG